MPHVFYQLLKQVKPCRLDGDVPKERVCSCYPKVRRRSQTFTLKSGLVGGSFLCLFGVVPEARDAANRHVFAAAAGVGGTGLEPSP